MNVLLFGATGMVGQGALRECLLDPEVRRVLVVGRRATNERHEKLRELVPPDVADLSAVESDLSGFDVCLFCLGVSSAGMPEDRHTRLSYVTATEDLGRAMIAVAWNGYTKPILETQDINSISQGRT